jgi:hypothetical protein
MSEFENLKATLLARSPLPPLQPPSVYRPELTTQIRQLKLAPLVEAGLHLWNDDLESAHTIAQENENPEGNYWHAILHRREGDFSNSLYWYRRVGSHPVLKEFADLTQSSPEKLVAACERAAANRDNRDDPASQRLQATEMTLLLNYLIAQK